VKARILQRCQEHGELLVEHALDDGATSLSLLAPIKDGKPIAPGSRLVQLVETGEPGLYEMKELCSIGPSKASTPKYRSGYDAVFGKRSELPN